MVTCKLRYCIVIKEMQEEFTELGFGTEFISFIFCINSPLECLTLKQFLKEMGIIVSKLQYMRDKGFLVFDGDN